MAGQGDITLHPLHISALLVADQLDLPRFSSYLNNRAGFLLKSGRADKLETRLTVTSGQKGKGFSLLASNAATEIHDLVITQNGIERVTVPKLTVKEGKSDLINRTVNFGHLQGETGIFHLSLNDTGVTDNGAQASMQPPWAMALDRFTLSRAMVLIEQTGSKPSSLAVHDLELQLRADSKQTDGKHLSIAGRLGAKDSFKLDGNLTFSPFAADLNALASKVPLTAVASLFGQGLRLQATAGLLSSKGILSLPACRFTGEAELENFIGNDAGGVETIRWRKATAKGFTYTPHPFAIQATRLDIDHPVVNWRLQPDRHTQLARLLLSEKNNGDRPTWDIKQLHITEGVAPINDNSVTPPFRAVINNIQGEIENFSDHPRQQSRISLQGKIDDDAPLRFTGATNLFHPDINTEFYAEIANFAVSRISPYLIPHLGYRLAAGKLAMQTTYRRQGKTVVGDNHLRVNNLDPGQKISNGQHLPLAIALLTDHDNHLAFDIPIRGTLSDADFSYRNSLIRGLRNLLLKTAVTPAALLAEINHNTPPATRFIFATGQETITEQGRIQLAELGEILRQRPLLGLTISGYADGVTDRETLREEQQRKLIARKAAEKRSQAAKLSRDLAATYGREEIKTPPAATDLPVRKEEAVVITDAHLLTLAEGRGQAVYDFLRDNAHINPSRLRLHCGTTKTAVTNSAAGAGNRVEFTLIPLSEAQGTP
ncbi:DUF748 domain-containing protein [Thermodesulfobacteriota bacterium]